MKKKKDPVVIAEGRIYEHDFPPLGWTMLVSDRPEFDKAAQSLSEVYTVRRVAFPPETDPFIAINEREFETTSAKFIPITIYPKG
jgi:hypothetical protein